LGSHVYEGGASIMTDYTIYFGLPGSLISLFDPAGGVSGTRIRQVAAFTTGSGNARVGKSVNGVRSYSLNYGGLGYTNFALLEAFDAGHMGVGPFVLLDPGRRNLLTANQSASGSVTNDATGFTYIGTSGISLSATALVTRGFPRSLRMTSTVAPSTSKITLGSAAPVWPGIPVAPRPYSFGYWALGSGSDPTVTEDAALQWLSSTGAVLSTTSGTAVSVDSTGWKLVRVQNAVPPSGAVYMLPTIEMTAATISNGTVVDRSGFILNEGDTLDPVWTPGTGVLPVVVMGIEDNQPQGVPYFRRDNTLRLQEVGV
jgi:hypothetical protein